MKLRWAEIVKQLPRSVSEAVVHPVQLDCLAAAFASLLFCSSESVNYPESFVSLSRRLVTAGSL